MFGVGFRTLLAKEILRFWKVSLQTFVAPVIMALLYLLIFSHVLDAQARVYDGVRYAAFLVPGLTMMSILQNAFANSSSSLIQSKVGGSIIFVMLPPISYVEFYLAYAIAATVRGLVVGIGVLAATCWFAPPGLHSVFWILAFGAIGGAVLGSLGIIAGIASETFDHLAAFQNFVVLPLTMLSGVFYSIHSLSPFWQGVSHVNPVFYMIDGFRYGFFGVSDVSPVLSLAVSAFCLAALAAFTLALLRRGYKLRV